MRSETRGFSVGAGATFTLRTKENLLEYRFIPEPDLPSLGVTRADVSEIVERHGLERRMEGLRERAAARLRQLEGGSIPESCIGVLSNDAALLRLFEGVLSALGGGGPVTARRAAQWLTGPFLGAWRAAVTERHGAVDRALAGVQIGTRLRGKRPHHSTHGHRRGEGALRAG